MSENDGVSGSATALGSERFERLNRYQRFTGEVSIYPGAGSGSPAAITYALFGLLGETSEVIGAGAKLFGVSSGTQELSDLKKELGDVGFYLARLALESGHEFSVIAAEAPTNGAAGSHTMLFALVSSTGALAEMSKKALRDDAGLEVLGHAPGAEWTKRSQAWLDQLRLAYQAWAALCASFFAVDAVLEANEAKLKSRRDRGVLRGSGDNRALPKKL